MNWLHEYIILVNISMFTYSKQRQLLCACINELLLININLRNKRIYRAWMGIGSILIVILKNVSVYQFLIPSRVCSRIILQYIGGRNKIIQNVNHNHFIWLISSLLDREWINRCQFYLLPLNIENNLQIPIFHCTNRYRAIYIVLYMCIT